MMSHRHVISCGLLAGADGRFRYQRTYTALSEPQPLDCYLRMSVTVCPLNSGILVQGVEEIAGKPLADVHHENWIRQTPSVECDFSGVSARGSVRRG